MGNHIIEQNLKDEHFFVLNNQVGCTNYETVLPLVGLTSYNYDVDSDIHNIACDTSTGVLTLRLNDPSGLTTNADNVAKILRISNVGNKYTGTGSNNNDIQVYIEGGGEFFQNLTTIRVKPNHSVEFALYKTTVSSVTSYKWAVRSGAFYRAEYNTSTTGVLSANTSLTWTLGSSEHIDLISISGTTMTFNFDGHVSLTSQSRINSNANTGSIVEVALTEKLNGNVLPGTGKFDCLVLDTNYFLQYKPEDHLFRVNSGDTFEVIASGGFDGTNVELVNINFVFECIL